MQPSKHPFRNLSVVPLVHGDVALCCLCVAALVMFWWVVRGLGCPMAPGCSVHPPLSNTVGSAYPRLLPGLLSPGECDALVDWARSRGLEPSRVVNEQTGEAMQATESRSSEQVWVRDGDHTVSDRLTLLTENLTGAPANQQEPLQIVRYSEGGRFHDHFDACASKIEQACEVMNRGAGQRRCTLLVFLNDDFEGGETEFPRLGMRIRPIKGNAILFWNTDAERNVILPDSLHRGNEVSRGEKWICIQALTEWEDVHACVGGGSDGLTCPDWPTYTEGRLWVGGGSRVFPHDLGGACLPTNGHIPIHLIGPPIKPETRSDPPRD